MGGQSHNRGLRREGSILTQAALMLHVVSFVFVKSYQEVGSDYDFHFTELRVKV